MHEPHTTGQGHWWGCELCSTMSRWLLLNTFCMHHHIDAWATYNRSRTLLGLWTLQHNVKVVLIKTFCMHHSMDAWCDEPHTTGQGRWWGCELIWATYIRSRPPVRLLTLQHHIKDTAKTFLIWICTLQSNLLFFGGTVAWSHESTALNAAILTELACVAEVYIASYANLSLLFVSKEQINKAAAWGAKIN